MLPDLAAHQRECIAEGWLGLMVPGGLSDRQFLALGVGMGHQRHQGEESQQDGGRPQDGQVRPLALGLHAQVFAGFVQSDFHLPA